MATRTPNSILLLIDRRNRLEGELKKLTALKRAAADLHQHVKAQLNATDQMLETNAGRFDEARVRTTYTLKTSTRGQFGLLTRLVIGALKASEGQPITATEVRDWVESQWPDGAVRPSDSLVWARNVRRRLRNLRLKGVLLSPEVGDGGKTRSTWIINPDVLVQPNDISSTLFDDDCWRRPKTEPLMRVVPTQN